MTEKLTAYLQHGRGTKGPFQTERVDIKETERPFFHSATGYGRKIPTEYMVKWLGRWRRVYVCQVSNASSFYIVSQGEWIFCDIVRGFHL